MSMKTVHFPDYHPFGPRGRCGKKNCTAQAHIFGIPTTLYFGGSGNPNLPPIDQLKPGDEITWKYNNMVMKNILFGWVIGRLDPERESIARLDEVTINGEQFLSVIYIRLYMNFEIKRIGLTIRGLEPIELELSNILGPDHFEFRQIKKISMLSILGLSPLSLSTSNVNVTSRRSLDFEDIEIDRNKISFRVTAEKPLSAIEGPLVWFLHNIEDPSVKLQSGLVNLGSSTTERVTTELNTTSTKGFQLEAVTLIDEDHLWAVTELN